MATKVGYRGEEKIEYELSGRSTDDEKKQNKFEDSEIDYVLTFTKPAEDKKSKCATCCNFGKCQELMFQSCFECFCMRCSPGGTCGPCWGCACPPCLRGVEAYKAVQEETDDSEGLMEKLEKDETKERVASFMKDCEQDGLQFEEQHCEDSPDGETYYLKVHGTSDGLLRAAEKMCLHMPIQRNILKSPKMREKCLDKLQRPFKPTVPSHLTRERYFNVPFSYENRKNFVAWDEKSGGYAKIDDWTSKDAGRKFFTSSQRSAIVHHILLEHGLNDLMSTGCFTSGFALHEGPYKEEEGKDLTDRSFLYKSWATPKNWYKFQPIEQIRRYFGEKIAIYFAWVGFYTMWLIPASIVGFIVFLYGVSCIFNPIAEEVCDDTHRYDYYMCPPCDGYCDFWYERDACLFTRIGLIFDNGGTVFFSVFMAFWVVLFLEYWKRRQFLLQFEWDMLGFEDFVQRARPQFEYRIKQFMAKCKMEEEKMIFKDANYIVGSEKQTKYVQPSTWYYPKVFAAFSFLATMSVIVIAIVLALIIYRLAITAAIYILVDNPSIGSITVSITGAIIQLVAILIMTKVYTYLAYLLTNWELHRTQTDYSDSYITKMYIFQFFNYYSSLFYIAFFKGNLAGVPGDYGHLAGLRVDECPQYGCLLELTIQLFIIMVGKQVLNNIMELVTPMVERFLKRKELAAADTRYEEDNYLEPLGEHGLFFEYLELVIHYGFITIFVAALPLAPLFALINNIIEIRLDAYKFVVSRRRPVAERAGDIGSWYGILLVISRIAVVSNAFLIAVTSQFIPQALYTFTGQAQMSANSSDVNPLTGYVNWSLSSFTVDKLLDENSFPAFSAQSLSLYDAESNILPNSSDSALYLPYVDTDCMVKRFPEVKDHLVSFENTGIGNASQPYSTFLMSSYEALFVKGDSVNVKWRDLILKVNETSKAPEGLESMGECFLPTTQCRFRGFIEDGGRDEDGNFVPVKGIKYLQIQLARVAFVVVFEHFVFVITFLLAWIVPDVPRKVKEEIHREKFLFYEALQTHKDENNGDN